MIAGLLRRYGVRLAAVVAIVTALLATAAVALGRFDPERFARDRIEDAFSSFTGGTLRIREIEVNWLRLDADARDVSIEWPSEGAPPLEASASRVRVRLAWQGLLGLWLRRVHLAEVEAEEPSIAFSSAFVRSLGRRDRTGSGLRLRIDRLGVSRGALRYDDREVPLELGVRDLEASASWSSSRDALVGEASLEGTWWRPPFARPYPVRFRSSFLLGNARLEIRDASITAPGLEGAFYGHVIRDAGTPIFGHARLSANLAALGEWLEPGFPEVSGVLEANLIVDADSGRLTALGPVHVRGGRVGPLEAVSAEAHVRYRGGNVSIRRLDAEAFGGRLVGEVDLNLSEAARFDARVHGEGIDAAALFALARVPVPFGARGELDLALEGLPASPATWKGSGRFAAAPSPGAGSVPARIEGSFVFADGRFRVPKARLESAATLLEIGVDARLSEEGDESEAVLSGSTREAGGTLGETLRVLDSLGVEIPAIAREPVQGEGTIRTILRLGEEPNVHVALRLSDGSWSGETFDEAALEFEVSGHQLDVARLVLEESGERWLASGVFDTEESEIEALDIEIREARIARAMRFLDLAANVEGRVSGALAVRRGAGGLSGGGWVALSDGQVFGERVALRRSTLDVREGSIVAEDLGIEGDAFEGRASAAFDLASGRGTIRLSPIRIDVSRLATLRDRHLDAGGEMEVEGAVAFEEGLPNGELTVSGEGVRIGEGRIGRVEGSLSLSSEALGFDLRGGGDARWIVSGSLGWEDTLPIRARGEFSRVKIALSPEDGAGPTAYASGEIEIHGPLAISSRLEGEGRLLDAELRWGDRSASVTEPVSLALVGGTASAGPFRITGPEVELSGSVSYRLEDGTIGGWARGSLDLGSVSALVPGIRAAGRVSVDVEAAGSATDPRLVGTIDVAEARMRLAGFPLRLDRLDARVRFDGSTFEIERARAITGGGEILVRGSGTTRGPEAGGHEIEIAVSNVVAEYPEGFRGVYEGRLALAGTADESRLSGALRIVRGSYATDFDVAALVGPRGLAPVEATAPRALKRVALDVSVRADEGVWVRNNVARLESRVALQLRGSLDRPEVTGQIGVLEGGTLTFRGVEYRVLSGALDFSNPDRIDPFLSVRAETRVDEYDIWLRVEGRLDKFDYDLTSNPPLTQQDIMALLVTGSTLDDWSQAAAETGTGGVAASYMSSSYVAGAVTGVLGEPLKKSFGLDQLRIDPFLVEGQADPTTRVTVGKKVSEELRLVYSADLGDAQKSIYKAEWQATRRFQWSGLYDTSGSAAAGVRYSQRFWLGPRGTVFDVPSVSPPGMPLEGKPVVSVAIEGVAGDEGENLARRISLREGDSFRRSRMIASAEELRRLEAGSNRFLARVTADALEAPGGVSVKYDVEPGPEVFLEIRDVPLVDRRRLRKRLIELWGEPAAPEDLPEDGEEEVRRYYRERGYYAVDVVRDEDRTGGRRVVRYTVDRGRRVRVERVTIEGADSIGAEEIRRELVTRRDGVWSRRSVKPADLDRDVATIRALYLDRGFLAVQADPAAVRLSLDGREAEVSFRVREGPRFEVKEVLVPEGLEVSSASLREWAGISVGEVYSPARGLRAESDLRTQLDARGFPDARVELRAVPDEGSGVTLRFEVSPGTRKTITGVEIVGNRLTRDEIIRREVPLAPGDPASRARLFESQHRLYKLGIFQGVRVDFAPDAEQDPGEQKVVVSVEEAPPFDAGVGLGYDTEGGTEATYTFGHENVGGVDRKVAIQGKYSGVENRLQFVAEEPRLFGGSVDGLFTAYRERREETGYNVFTRSVGLRVGRRPEGGWGRYVRYSYQDVSLSGVVDEIAAVEDKLEDVQLGNVSLAIVRNTRDDVFAPTRGGLSSAELSIFGPLLLSEERFAKLFLRGAFVKTFRNDIALSGGTRIGAAKPFGSTLRVPISERYFAGGESTLRGFARDSVGPSSDGVPTGGEALAILNLDCVFPILGPVRGVLFADVGGVWEDLSSVDSGSLREDAGIGLRVLTPIGPIRAEYGWKLDRQPEETPGQFYFSVGILF